ncbi:PAS domain-containing sensor histidine kinase [Halogranum rubrum]|uniref:PAS domain-containing sensor histidine kinase n=1 Tax=Halogranum rubrum TaxID=553466 RepID=UPI000677C8F9|nr:PAS domain S-box protein [Halogranum salarium]
MTRTGPELVEEASFRDLVDQIADYGIFLLDVEGRVVTWNQGAERIKGYTEEEIQGEHFSRFYPESARERGIPERQLATAIDEGRSEDYGWRVRKDGSRFWAHVVITSVWDEDDELLGFAKVTHDLREHGRTNEILDRVSDSFAALEDQLRYTYVNEQAEKLLGRPRDELLGRSMTSVFPETKHSRSYTELHRALETQRQTTYELYSEVTGGWLEVRVYPDEAGLSVFFKDITEQRRQTKRLAEEKELVEQILETSPVAITVLDDTGTVVQHNTRAEELFNEDERPLMGRNLESTEGMLYDEEHAPLPLDEYPVDEVLADGKTILGFRHGIELADGTFRWLSSSFAPIVDDEGDVVRMVVTSEDITELKLSEFQLQEQQKELERSNDELEQFAYIASHDLREPLRMVSSYLDLLERRYGEKLDEEGVEFLQFALDGSRRLQQMIHALLAYSRVARQLEDVGAVDFADVVERAQQNLALAIEQTDAEITTESLPVLDGSETVLVQLMQNLLGNAIRYSEGTPRIHVSAEQVDDHWLFAVRDEGVGIAVEELSRVFGLFYGNSTEGSGIGLAVCQKIVELHGGHIWVESAPGEGSTFYFTLPK